MAVPLTDNDALIHEIMRLAEEAAQFHGSMAGSAVFPESFIRDWVAIELHRQHKLGKLGVTIETGRADVRKYVVDENQWSAHDLLDLKNYRLDMIVWAEDSIHPRAIVEFKRSLGISDDLIRTSGILSVAHRQGLAGYMVVCIVFDQKEKFAGYKAQLDSMPDDLRDGDILIREPAQVRNGEGTAWCGVFAVKVKPRRS